MAVLPSVGLEHEVSLRDVIRVVWAKRWFVIAITALAVVIAVAAALLVAKKYTASVLVASATSAPGSGQFGALTSQLGGLAALAGVSVQGDTKKSESVAVLQSEALTEAYIRENDLLPVLYAKQWNADRKTWSVSDPEEMPTLWKANLYFRSKIRTVSTDAKTGLVTVTIVWKDPKLAAKWANGLVRMTNDYLRSKAIDESERNIAYLTDQAAKTDVLGVKQAVYSILQTEVGKVMLAKGNEEYALKILDSAIPPEVPSSPKLALWAVIGFLAGSFTALLVVFTRSAWHAAGATDAQASVG